MYQKFFLTLCILMTSCLSGFALEVSFFEHADVADGTIRLEDIANFNETTELSSALGSQILGNAPALGESVILEKSGIIKTLSRKTTLPPSMTWAGASKITVKRTGQEIGTNALSQAISQFLNDNDNRLPDAEIRFIASTIPLPFLVPEGEIAWEIVPSSPNILDSTRISIIIHVDGRVRKNFSIPGKFQALAPVAIAASSLKRGEILTPDNTKMEIRDLTEYHSPCLDLRQILGKKVKRSLGPDKVIDISNVEIPPLVQKGQLVKIIIDRGNIHLSATGIARANGKLNQVIRVQNAQTNKLIYCKVTAPGIVEVNL